MKDSTIALTVVPLANRERMWAVYKGERLLAVLATSSVQPFLARYRALRLRRSGGM